MLYLNLKPLLRERGIVKPVAFLVKSGFSYNAAHALTAGGLTKVSLRHVERLCLVLNCTPNDLFAWRKPEDAQVPEKHPLHRLQPKVEDVVISEVLLQLPLERLEQVREFVKGLKEE